MSIYYTKEHEWLSINGNTATIGITAYAQDQLGDLIFVELPQIGEQYKTGEPVVVVESVKAASDVYAPIGGTIIEVNEALNADPSIINKSPQEQGWLWKMEISDKTELECLLDAESYEELLNS